MVEEIIKVKVNDMEEDKKMWLHDKHGKYTVKSAYQVGSRILESPSDFQVEAAVMSRFWRLQLPANLQLFLWKLYMGYLPTGEFTKQRKISEGLCSFCNQHLDDAYHLFIQCTWVRGLWVMLNVRVSFRDGEMIDVKKWLLYILDHIENPDTYLVGVTWAFGLQGIWKVRNQIIFDNHIPNLEAILSDAHFLATEWVVVHRENTDEDMHATTLQQNVSNYVYHGTKITVDGSFHRCSKKAGSGAVLWESSEDIQAVGFNCITTNDALEAEVKAVEIGLKLAKEMGINEITLVGDNKELMEDLGNNIWDCSWACYASFSRIIQLYVRYISVHYVWGGRDSVIDAHLVANWARLGISEPCPVNSVFIPVFIN